VSEEPWVLLLYVVGLTPVAARAMANITAICEEYLQGHYSIETIDLLLQPARAESDQIFAVPTLVRRQPGPLRKVIGDLSNHQKVLLGMDLRPAA
jgi:circadian clock protein KaiB